MKKYLIITGIILICLLIFQVKLSENVFSKNASSIIYVGGHGDGNFTYIQSAINNASDGDIIYLYNNIYLENININKSIIIVGNEKESCIIDGTSTGDVITLKADNIIMDNLTISNSRRQENDIPCV